MESKVGVTTTEPVTTIVAILVGGQFVLVVKAHSTHAGDPGPTSGAGN